MAQKVLVKRSAVAAKVPTTTDLSLGEIAVNTYDGKMYIKKDNGTPSIVEIGAGGSFLPLSGGTLTGTLNGTDITVTGTVTAAHFDNVSDETLKTNIESIGHVGDLLDQLHPVSFTWVDSGQAAYGFIAQEVERVLPTLVRTREDGLKTVSYVELIALLLCEIQDLRRKVLRLETR